MRLLRRDWHIPDLIDTDCTVDTGAECKCRNVIWQDSFGLMRYASMFLACNPDNTEDRFWVNRKFDVMGRLLCSEDPGENVISVAYQPGRVFQFDGNSNMIMNKLALKGLLLERILRRE